MEWVETTGKTVEEAKDAALDQLGVDEQDAEFEVLAEPKAGLFGRLRVEARVRARVRPTSPRPKAERRGGRRGAGRDRDAGRSRDRDAGRASNAERDTTRAPSTRAGADEERAVTDEDVPMTRQVEVAEGFLQGLLQVLEVPASIASDEVDEDTHELRITGDDGLGFLIGPKGDTLNALQELTRTVVQRRTGGRNGRLLVDVSGYRQKRREALARFTRQVADEVRSSGARRVLEPMHPADRKVVHDTANDIDGVTTASEGEEPRRRVVIEPSNPT